jgi:hypothetical protein
MSRVLKRILFGVAFLCVNALALLAAVLMFGGFSLFVGPIFLAAFWMFVWQWRRARAGAAIPWQVAEPDFEASRRRLYDDVGLVNQATGLSLNQRGGLDVGGNPDGFRRDD